MTRRLVSLVAAVVLLLGGLGLEGKAGIVKSSLERSGDRAEAVIFDRLSKTTWLSELAPNLLLLAGAKEQDGIFVAKNQLIENIKPADETMIEQNIADIKAFLSAHSQPAWMLLIPTAAAIKQSELSSLAALYNQKALISQVYESLSGQVVTIDAYSELFALKDQYIYRRTDSSLTGLGGYCVYRALATRLGVAARRLGQFEADNLTSEFYGGLYERSSYKAVRPDFVTLYRFLDYERRHMLTHWEAGERRRYYTLFPNHLELLYGAQSVVLGGFSPRIDIEVASPYEESFLIIADSSAMSYLPFLLVHFGNVTVLDLSRATEYELGSLDLDEYDRVMFGFSVDSFITRRVALGADRLTGRQ